MRTFILSACLFSFSAVAAQTHGVDTDWYAQPKAAVTSSSPDLNGAVANNMVVKSNGEVVFFYRKNNMNFWTSSPDGGNTWNQSVLGTPAPNAANGMSSVTADIDQADKIYIAWKSAHFTLSFSEYNGISWSTPVSAATNGGTSNDTIGFSQISVDRDGRIHLMWQQGDHGNAAITSSCWYARSVDGGVTFSTPVRISGTNTTDAAFPVADFSGCWSDTLIIAWRENITSSNNFNSWDWDVKAVRSFDGGATWSAPFTLAGGTHNQWDPNVVIDKKGFVHVFYHLYHAAVMPDLNADVHYVYSTDGGASWSADAIISDTSIRSHLIKTAYDYNNDAVWCFWKDERNFSGGNAQADIIGLYVPGAGVPSVASAEFICDHDTVSVGYHNFKVGNDGIVRAVYNNIKAGGKGDTIFYSQRNALVAGIQNSPQHQLKIFPNPVQNTVTVETFGEEFTYKLTDMSGKQVTGGRSNCVIDVASLQQGVYLLEVRLDSAKFVRKLIRQ